jgi:hypothetical protein
VLRLDFEQADWPVGPAEAWVCFVLTELKQRQTGIRKLPAVSLLFGSDLQVAISTAIPQLDLQFSTPNGTMRSGGTQVLV